MHGWQLLLDLLYFWPNSVDSVRWLFSDKVKAVVLSV